MNMRNLIITAALFALLAATPSSALRYIAVVETGIDEASGASADLTSAEVRLITAELRREAVKSLPRDKYNVITSETVQSMGGAVLEECSEENCIITLGSKIGADYIVRGTVSKFKDELTLTVDIFETNDGTLVASSDRVSSVNAKELLVKGAMACGEMYKAFAGAQGSVQESPKQSVTYAIAVAADPPNGGTVSLSPNQTYYEHGTVVSVTAVPADGYTFTGWSGSSKSTKAALTAPIDRDLTLTANFQSILWQTPAPDNNSVSAPPPKPEKGAVAEEPRKRGTKNGFSLGYVFSGETDIVQAGFAQSRPIGGAGLSFVWESNIWVGNGEYYYIDIGENYIKHIRR